MKKEVVIPSAGESIQEVELLEWKIQEGDQVEVDDLLIELETEKATLELRSPMSGIISLKSPSGATAHVGDVIALVDDSVKVQAKQKTTGKENNSVSKQPSPNQNTQTAQTVQLNADLDKTSNGSENSSIPIVQKKHATPSSRKLIQENELNLQEITPSGRGGRIIKEDVIATLNQSKQSSIESQDPLDHTNGHVNYFKRSETKVKMTRLRRTIAERLVQSQQTAALLTTFNEVDMSEVIKMRKQYKEEFKKKHNVNLGFMSFFVKAVCQSIEAYPIINSMIDGNDFISFNYVDVGIAVSTPKGLVVPVIKDSQKKTFDQIEKKIIDFASRGQDGKLELSEMTGGNFTITNGGTFGSMLSTPIVNYPQSAILGMHNIVERPVVRSGEIVIRPIMYLALSYDHRLIDGSDAVRFLYRVKELIEDPYRLLIKV